MSKIKPFPKDFKEVTISLASPESILARSFGEVITPETKNHRHYKGEFGGFFCPRIFGPEKDWECACGKYKGIKYKNTICDQCNVELNESKVRRERMGHIKLPAKLVHPWFFQHHPNVLAHLLNIPSKKLENIIYYTLYVVLQPGLKAKDGLKKMDLLSLKEYDKHVAKLPKNHLLSDNDPNKFIAQTGGDVIEALLKSLDLDSLSKELRETIENETSMQRRDVAVKRLKIVEAFRNSNKQGIINKPEWMVIRYLPVMSPKYRPLILLHNSRLATSDTTELLKTLLMRSNRLKQLIDMRAPNIIILNEKRMLQASLNKLFDYSGKTNITSTNRTLRSLADRLKGKGGYMRKDGLLGKRTDFSGRTVITTNPKLKLNECGIPKAMAIVLYQPYIIHVLKQRGLIRTYKEGKKIVEQKSDIVWSILENVIQGHPVLLNRAPTLHRHGIQAFYPKLVEGKSIHLHPLVCQGFNADHDGDMMGLHLPLGQEAIAEASMLLLPSKNMLDASNGAPMIVPSKDIVLGLYYLTKGKQSTPQEPVKGEGAYFSSIQEGVIAFNNNKVSHKAYVKLRISTPEGHKTIDTVVGRILFNQYIPKELRFINEVINSQNIYEIVLQAYKTVDEHRTTRFLDDIKSLGFEWISKGGLTFGLDDLKTPPSKAQIIQKATKEVEEVQNNYYQGFITNIERYNQVIDIWTKVGVDITNELSQILSEHKGGFNTLFMMNDSGARGSKDQLRYLCGIRGLIAAPKKNVNAPGSIIERPIISSLKEGFRTHEYFNLTRGSRKGLADTTLKTADAGFFARRLVYAVQNIFISQKDCGTLGGRLVQVIYEHGKVKVPLSTQVISRIIASDVIDPSNESILFKRGQLITEKVANEIDELGLKVLKVRSPIYCEAKHGICIQCYGLNLGNNKMAIIGDVVGNLAAQGISQPGTQLTLRKFHASGGFSGNVVEDTLVAFQDGVVDITNLQTVNYQDKQIVISKNSELKVIDPKAKIEHQSHLIPYGATLFVTTGQKITKEDIMFEWNPYKIPILAHIDGVVQFENIKESFTYKKQYNELTGYTERLIIDSMDKDAIPSIIVDGGNGKKASYTIPIKAQLSVDDGDKVKAGQLLAQIPRPKSTPQDVVGGLPRVTKLLEMQKPTNKAVITTIDGTVSIGDRKRTNITISVTPKEGSSQKYKVPVVKQLLVQNGDYVQAGTPLSEGSIATVDILKVKGLNAFCNHIIQEIQAIYQQQGVVINDKHFEIILRQMTQKVVIESAGDTDLISTTTVHRREFTEANARVQGKKVVLRTGDTRFQVGDIVTQNELKLENEAMAEKNLTPADTRNAKMAIAAITPQGITKTATKGDSFLASASFQQTIKVLLDATIHAKRDRLLGIIENDIVGRLVPAGTGLRRFQNLQVASKEAEKALQVEATP